MKAATFVLSYALFVVADGAVTWALISQTDISIIHARSFGATFCAIGFGLSRHSMSESSTLSPLLAGCIGIVSTVVSYGIFALLISRNAMLQWPVPFIASATAALLLCSFGYWRTNRIGAESD